MEFNPPPPPSIPPYATYIEDRRPQFKVHRTLGLAKSAVGAKIWKNGMRGGIVYELKDGQTWVELFRVEPGTQKIDHPAFREREIKEGLRAARRSVNNLKKRVAEEETWAHKKLMEAEEQLREYEAASRTTSTS